MFTSFLASSINIPNPDGWVDGIVILLATAMVAIPSWLAVRSHKTMSRVEGQVANGHKRPLREDLDKVIESIERLSADVRMIRRELQDEEERRRNHVSDVHISIRELREEFHRKIAVVNRESANHDSSFDDVKDEIGELKRRLDGKE